VALLLLGSCSTQLPDDVAAAYEQLPEKIDFNQHVRTLLSDRCYSCHGPDEASRQAGLRLDLEDFAKAKNPETGNYAIVAGRPGKSELVERILTDDPELIMPELESNLVLNAQEKAVLVKWIEQGAEYKKHWAFIPPQKHEAPTNLDPMWAHNEIDQFVLQKLEANNLKPSQPTTGARLLRRISFDLRGLPPTIAELDAFEKDNSATALDRMIDEMLASDDCAERLTLEWLDVARYADSHGLHADGWRNAWPWRDWVIDAFRQNMPYDQFITEQLAGDLLPKPTKDQILATAFNRNHPMTAEGGAIDEEFRLEYVFDRTNTTATAFLGLTMECARCHDHKFDPISQKEYYQMTAFFNNVKELGMTGDDGNYGPLLLLIDEETEAKVAAIDESIRAKEMEVDASVAATGAIAQFIKALPPQPSRKPLVYLPFETVTEARRKNKSTFYFLDGKRNAFFNQSVELAEGHEGKAIAINDEYNVPYLSELGNFELNDAFSASVHIKTTKRQAKKTQTLLGNTGHKNNFWRGWEFYLDEQNRIAVRLIHNLPENYFHIRSADSVRVDQWTQVAFAYDGSGSAKGVALYINGKKAASEIPHDKLYKSIKTVSSGSHQPTDRPIRIGKSYRGFTGENGIYQGLMDELYLFDRKISALEGGILGDAIPNNILTKDVAELSPNEKQLVEAHQFATGNPNYLQLQRELKNLRGQKMKLLNPVEEIMVMEEMDSPRKTYLLDRGVYDAPLEEVELGTPEQVLSFPDDLPNNRLGLAQWITDRNNPLAARVAVNRYWQMLFGQGLVDTPQDFGSQGSLPSHPELLDWLAIWFMDNNWDVKALLKLIVSSATYQQQSSASAELLEQDPYNRLLARGPKHRLSAELIRDNALHASGLLVRKVGGESVRPYQPEGLWIDKGTFSHVLLRYEPTMGDSLYRKSMYTFVKRTSPHPAMIAFDAPSREVCTVQRENTNTPLQALVLLNDPGFVECARVLAQRMQKESNGDFRQMLTLAYRWLTSRPPKEAEMALLEKLYEEQLKEFQTQPAKARELLAVGEFPFDVSLNRNKTAALTMVASTIMNMDEFYMKR
ncbi:MAG: DUF1553 domain-containing protein, partial [Bacteroidota bacterium]